MPRRIDAMLLAAANRAEVMVRCAGDAGDEFVLSAVGNPNPFTTNGFDGAMDSNWLQQPVLARIRLDKVRKRAVGFCFPVTASSPPCRSWALGSSSSDSLPRLAPLSLSSQSSPPTPTGPLDSPLAERVCTPRRPDYAPDLQVGVYGGGVGCRGYRYREHRNRVGMASTMHRTFRWVKGWVVGFQALANTPGLGGG